MTARMVTTVGDCSNEMLEEVKACKAGEEVFFVDTTLRKQSKNLKIEDDDDAPLVDTTAALPLRSKKTERAQKRLRKKHETANNKAAKTTLLELPLEILLEILGYLKPSDLIILTKVGRNFHDIIQENEQSIALDIIRRRYWVLARCFFLPVALSSVPSSAHAALLSERRQDMLQLHRKPYEHIKGIDPLKVCTCINCVLAWNQLCLILDLSHWQRNLNEREPIPIIPRGAAPEWNKKLIEANASVVEKAMVSPLTHARILEKHLLTTTGTIMRTVRKKKTVHPRRLYHLTPADAAIETDEFLERMGPPSHEFPWRRDYYHYLEAFVPNRVWSKDRGRWIYYAQFSHEKDLQWVVERFAPKPAPEKSPDIKADLKRHSSAGII